MKTKDLRKWAKRIARDTDAMVVLAYLVMHYTMIYKTSLMLGVRLNYRDTHP